ncbi:MAG: hypothetical protein ABI435_06460 [Pseudolysinimonas sp.]
MDPRYAAQFQRGFQGEPLDPPDDPAQRRAPVRLSGGRPAAAELVAPHATPPASVRSTAPLERPASEIDIDPAVDGIARPIWSERILFGGGALLVVLSIWLFLQLVTTATASQSATGSADLLWVWAQSELPAPLLVGGIVALCGGLVLGAFRTRVR